MDPRAVDLDRAACVPGERPSPARRDSRDAAAPRDDLDPAVVEEGDEDVDTDGAEDPEVLRSAPTGLVDVVRRDVLEVSRDGVEPQAPGRVRVGEPDAVGGAELPAYGRT
jgi:hypothetical protein